VTVQLDRPQRLAVIGQGYVGLPLSMLAVEAGYQVIGVDADLGKVERLRHCDSYVDDVSDDQLRAATLSGRFTATEDYADIAGFDIAVITVPTPLRDRSPDLSFVVSAANSIGGYLSRGSLVVLESTTFPGTTEDIVRPELERASGLAAGPDFSLAYSPERVDPGNTTWTMSSTPKVVAGLDATALRAVSEFYGKLVSDVVPVSSPRTAELTKLLENTFRHVNIALVNEFAIFAQELGISMWEVVTAASTKPFGFMPFYPGPGVGGHCLPIDPTYLSWHVQQATGRRFRLIELANDINEQMPDYVVRRVSQGLNQLGKPVRGARIVALGVAYKKNSSDVRESPARQIVQLLTGLGAQVQAVDAHVPVQQVPADAGQAPLTADALRAADAVVILTDHDDVDYDLVAREARWVLDCRNRIAGPNVEVL
jgi:UDP-N-acetyl-D-glucosamine dehydrogenase